MTPILQLGFRPFFLLAGIAGIILIGTWILIWPASTNSATYYPPTIWHAHEMLFGYTAAVIAGFLLTAIRNWTGIDTPTGMPLLILILIWLAGRLLPLFPQLPGGLIAIIDVIFLPELAVSLIRPLWQGKSKINRVFIGLILLMAVANGLVHAELLGYTMTASIGITMMLDLVLLLILMVSGRVLPFFTNMAIPGTSARQWPWVERATIVLMILLTLTHLLWNNDVVNASLWILLAIIQLVRISGWYNHGIWDKPVLWVLYSGYGWLIVGVGLSGLSALERFPGHLSTHALTVGTIGIFTLGMMARVSLGHTGRAMQTAMPINLSFLLLNIGALVRVFIPVLLPTYYEIWIKLSGGLWLAAFTLFVIVYAPILLKPRIDGKSG